MYGEKQKKFNFKKVFIILLILAAIVVGGICLWESIDFSGVFSNEEGVNYVEKIIDGKTYYQRIGTETWKGRYRQDEFYSSESVNKVMKVLSYAQYLDKLELVNSSSRIAVKQHYGEEFGNYIVLAYSTGHSWCKMDLIDCVIEGSKIIIYGDERVDGVMADGSGYFIVIPTDMAAGTEVEYRECYSKDEINNIKKYGVPYNPSEVTESVSY